MDQRMIMFKFNGVAGKPRFSIDVCALLLNNCNWINYQITYKNQLSLSPA